MLSCCSKFIQRMINHEKIDLLLSVSLEYEHLSPKTLTMSLLKCVCFFFAIRFGVTFF